MKYGKKIGSGFWNFLRRKKSEPNTTIRKLPLYPPRYGFSQQTPISNSFKPFNYETQNERREFFPEYESYRNSSDRMFAFIYQKYKNKNQPYNPLKISLTPAERSELKTAIFKEMNSMGILHKNLTQDSLNNLIKALFGLKTDNEVKAFNEEFIRVESTIPESGVSKGLKPLRPFSYFSRLIPALLKSEREMQYTSNQEMYMCIQKDIAKNTYRSLNSDDCVFITRSIPHLFRHLLGNFIISNVFYIVLNPIFFPVGTERTKSKTYNTTINSKFNEPVSVKMFTLNKISFIQDAFQNGGLQLIHPRLGLLLQEQLPTLWNKSCFNTKTIKSSTGRSLDLIDRVVILTLQKYAAIRRYMWTKDPNSASQIYQVNPLSITNELRDPGSVLSSSIITDKNRHSEYFDILRDIPTYMKFDKAVFNKEFIENQQWASNKNTVKYKSIDDPALNNILPKNCNYWAIPAQFKDLETTSIPKLNEMEQVEQQTRNNSSFANMPRPQLNSLSTNETIGTGTGTGTGGKRRNKTRKNR